MLAVTSKFMNWAEDLDFRKQNTNPTRGIKKYPTTHRARFLTKTEYQELGKVIRIEVSKNTNPYSIAAIQLLIYTGARLSEILELKWKYVDLKQRLISLPDSKTGRKAIMLSKPAFKILKNIPKQKNNPYVICGKISGQHLVNLQKPWRHIRKLANLTDVRIHDLRHSFASVGARQGGSLPAIGTLLGHSQSQTTDQYAHLIQKDFVDFNDSNDSNDSIGTEISGYLKSS